MIDEILVEILILVVLILLNAVFAMSELAIVSARKSSLQNDANSGDRRARIALNLANSPSRFLSTVQVGITLIGVLAGVYGGATVASSLAEILQGYEELSTHATQLAYFIVIGGITILTLVLGELVPKRVALAYPEAVAKFTGPFLRLLLLAFGPLVKLLELSTNGILRFLPVQRSDAGAVTEEEIKLLLAQGSESGVIEEAEEKIVTKVLRLGDRLASSLMTPRSEIAWIDVEKPLGEGWKIVCESQHYFFPVGRGTVENTLGIVSLRDMSMLVSSKEPRSIVEIVREPLTIPSNMTALRALERFRETNERIALIIDEYGGLDGIITMHDLMESIVGGIGDDENGESEFVTRDDGSSLVDASMDVDEVFERLGLCVMESVERKGYHSLGGFVMGQLGHIPAAGESFEFSGFMFEVVDMDKHRVDKVLISRQLAEM